VSFAIAGLPFALVNFSIDQTAQHALLGDRIASNGLEIAVAMWNTGGLHQQ